MTRPVLMSRTVNLHPVVIVLSLALGGVVAGIIGAVSWGRCPPPE